MPNIIKKLKQSKIKESKEESKEEFKEESKEESKKESFKLKQPKLVAKNFAVGQLKKGKNGFYKIVLINNKKMWKKCNGLDVNCRKEIPIKDSK